MNAIFTIDPGPTHSAWVALADGRIRGAKVENTAMLDELMELAGEATLAIEMIASYGMPVGAEVFETCVWIGRFMEASCMAERVLRITRHEVKMHLCHSAKARDSNIRQAIIDRYGGKDAAIGKKATPGPLYGISGDCWAALAVALVVLDRQREAKAA